MDPTTVSEFGNMIAISQGAELFYDAVKIQ
jgi:hypothetical protein